MPRYSLSFAKIIFFIIASNILLDKSHIFCYELEFCKYRVDKLTSRRWGLVSFPYDYIYYRKSQIPFVPSGHNQNQKINQKEKIKKRIREKTP